jgi:tight adherence protein B
MLPSILIIGSVFLGVVALVIGAAMFLRDKSEIQVEDRLSSLTGKGAALDPSSLSQVARVISKQSQSKGGLEAIVSHWFNLPRMFEQAEVSMSVGTFLGLCLGIGLGASALCGFAGVHWGLAPVVGFSFCGLPFFWLMFRRKRRLSKFAAQLSDALELIARALRAGHSLAAGFQLVAQEGSDPIASEFGRVFEEQNLGIPFEEALGNITERVPNLDLKFFVTAIILQRQTGGDLAEILDKIGRLIRERYKIMGQVQALTGEGRISGVVLLALPPVLFVTVYRMNPEYIMLLFTDDLGKKMLLFGLVSQILGALVIRKIVNIRI